MIEDLIEGAVEIGADVVGGLVSTTVETVIDLVSSTTDYVTKPKKKERRESSDV